MDINQMKVSEVVEEEVKFEWPQAYYLPTDGEERKRALDKADEMQLDTKLNEVRRIVWERRYDTEKNIDYFLAGWMNLIYYATVLKDRFMARFHRKDMMRTKQYLCYDIVDSYGELGKEVLFMECYHLVDYYIDICLKDKKYSSVLMGMGTMKKEKLIAKIAQDIYNACYKTPRVLEIGPVHEKVMAKAATQCYYNRFPKDKNYLESLIDTK